LSSRIIPKEMLGPELRKANLDEFSGSARNQLAAEKKAAPASTSNDLDVARIRDEAYRQGLIAGRQEATQQTDAERAALKRLTDTFQEMMQDFEQGLAKDVLSMSLELAKLIIREAVRVQPELVLTVVREAVSSLAGMDEQTAVHLHPADAALLREVGRDDPTLAGLPWKIVEDSRIERGGCKLETASTEIDATLETRWRRVIAALGREDSWIDISL
jgi:flagellar assembly protein FliH